MVRLELGRTTLLTRRKTMTLTNAVDNATTSFAYQLTSDKLVEGDETFVATLVIGSGSNPSVKLNSGFESQTVTIDDDDTATVSFDSASGSVAETNAAAVKNVSATLSVNPTGTVGYAGIASSVTAGISVDASSTVSSSDYTLGALVFPSFSDGTGSTTANLA